MRKIQISERPNWRETAAKNGFTFADMHGEPYWEETSAYAFTLDQIENDLEDPATELHAMCREAAAHIVASEELMEKLGIPKAHWDMVAESWQKGEPELYGRMDFVYDGTGPAKLMEYNADTPTSLYESASFQWLWLEEQIAAGVLPAGADQFNSIHEAIRDRFKEIYPNGGDVHFAGFNDQEEDYATIEALGWAARDAGLGAHLVDVRKIGIDPDGQFTDEEDRVIGNLFKLYPWEDMLLDEFAARIPNSGCRFLEPAWKAVVSNKGILPVLWQMFPNHPNLLPAVFEGEGTLDGDVVAKPIFSREGAGVEIRQAGKILETSKDTSYDHHPRILQGYAQLPVFEGFRPVIGAWIAGHTCCGIGIREDRSRITQDLSRFKPHVILD